MDQNENASRSESRDFPTSKQISKAMYHYNNKTLDIVFRANDSLYRYADVPEEVWNGLKVAESPGKYVNSEIKAKYSYTKIY